MNNRLKTVAEFQHYQGGHCETGGVSSLLKNHGCNLSEPMALGISGGITFFYMPLVKIWNNPLISYRMAPQHIRKGVEKRLGVRFITKTYKDQGLAMEELDALLSGNQPVGLQTGLNYLTYFLPEFRIYFNAHTTIIYGREGDEYLVSDPMFDHITRIHRSDLQRARFAMGPDAPHGYMFYPVYIPERFDYAGAIKKGIKGTVNMMLQPLLPFVGIKGINTVAKRIEGLQAHPDKKYVRNFLGHIVLFQEEIGTGGGGFRFMYAAFLKEAYDMLHIPELLEASKKMVATGDLWRKTAFSCARIIKGKQEHYDLKLIADMYRECARHEREVYAILKKIKWD